MRYVYLILIFSFGFISNRPDHPTSIYINQKGEKTGLFFDSINAVSINTLEETYDESSVFKRKKKDLTEWTLDTISPTMIPEDRELAYTYYSDIPGMVWIEKVLFCDETEVTNLDWIEYLQLSGDVIKHSNSNLIMKSLNYNFNEQFCYFPVVGISYEDAIKYCKWRTKIVTENYNKQKGYNTDSSEYTIFEFTLPTKEEWIKCASFATDTIKFPHLFITDKLETKINKNAIVFLNSLGSKITETDLKNFNKNIKNDYPFNCKRFKNSYLNLETPFYVWDYPTNNFGIYNIMGNVSEMIAEKGIAKGGSFRDEYKTCTINNDFNYSKPSENIGFRCVCNLKWPNR